MHTVSLLMPAIGLCLTGCAETLTPDLPPASTERLPAERLKDIERLRDQGYLNAEEYERKRAEILKAL